MVEITELPTGKLGLYGGRNMTRISGEYLLQADNLAADDGTTRKEGGAAKYNNPLPLTFSEEITKPTGAYRGIVWTGSIFVIVGIDSSNSEIHTSPDGVTWTQRFSAGGGLLNGIAWSGSLFVAVGNDDATDAELFTSPDAITWTERSNPKAIDLNSVAWNGTVFVAVGDADGSDAYIVTSSDGTAWTERSNPKNFALFGVTWAEELGLFIAVGAADGTDAYIITSPDGITWTERSNPKNFALWGVSWNGSILVAVGQNDGTDAYIVTSADGITWTERSNPKNIFLRNSYWNNDVFVAVGDGNVGDGDGYTVQSPDGITWTEVLNAVDNSFYDVVWNGSFFLAVGDGNFVKTPSTASFTERSNPQNENLFAIDFSGETYCAVGVDTGSDAYIITSTDLATWTERSNPKDFTLWDVLWARDQFLAVGAADGTDAYIITSDDGETWTERSNPKNFDLIGVAWNENTYCAVGAADGTDAYIVTSPDGKNWTERSNPKNFGLDGIAWNGSLFVAVGVADGSDAYLVTSPDGATWTERSNPKNFRLRAVTWNGSIFCAVGEPDGTDAYIVTSADGITWTERSNPKNFALHDVAWNGVAFMAVGDADGDDGYAVLSPDGETWTEVANPKNFQLRGLVWDKANFVAVGLADGTDAYLLTYDYDALHLLGAFYWNYDGDTEKIVTLDTSGRLLMDDFDGDFLTQLDTGLTVDADTYPIFVEGGKEAAANDKKLFIFTGQNAVQVLSGNDTTTSDLSTPPADWSGSNQPSGGLIHEERLWGYGNANDPHRLYYSLTTDHEDFTSSGAGSITVYPGEGQKIVNAISFKGYIIVFKYPKGIYFVDTTSSLTTNWRVGRISGKIGAAGPGSADVKEDDVIFVDRTGEIRTLSGISEFGDIGTTSLSDVNSISTWIRDNLNIPSNTKWRMVYYETKRELHIACSSNQLGINDYRLVIDFNNQVPMFRYSSRDVCTSLFTRELNGIPELMATDNLGNIWRLDQEDRNKGGLGYTAKLQIPYLDLGQPNITKNGLFLEIAFEPTGDYNLVIDVLWDGAYYETYTVNMSAPNTVVPGRMISRRLVEIGGSGYRFSAVLRNGNADEDFRLQAMWLHWEPGVAA